MSKRGKISFPQLEESKGAKPPKIHFVGAGGAGMCSLVRISAHLGAECTGSDREVGENLTALANEGIKIILGHRGENVSGAELVVSSLAISDDNPELVAARENGIPCVTRPEFLGYLNLLYRERVAVAGTHGKSTTVAMLDAILVRAGKDPTVLSGARLIDGVPTRIGGRNLMLYEACEYKDAFLYTNPTAVIVTNVEMDHPDYFLETDHLKRSFIKFCNSATSFVLLNQDDPQSESVLGKISPRCVTFGSSESSVYRYSLVGFCDGKYKFKMYCRGASMGEFSLPTLGVFNVSNAVAAIACATELGVDTDHTRAALAEFYGISRRLEYIGRFESCHVFYDYAHHPTEINCGITALKSEFANELTVVFKPHTFTRTRALWDDFVGALRGADCVILTDIYPAREDPIPHVTAERLAEDIGETAVYSKDCDVVRHLSGSTGVIAVMGAGDVTEILSTLNLKTPKRV